MKRVLILEPYYGGSHKHFLEGLQKHIAADYVVFTLPARKWKMRMQLSAPWCIQQIESLHQLDRKFDVVLCSSFVDVAGLRGLLTKVVGWNLQTIMCTYFHENQIAYPARKFCSPSFHFAAINYHSALASDKIAFNSRFNKETFFDGCRRYLHSASEMGVMGTLDEISKKSCILHPGVDFTSIDQLPANLATSPPCIIWNHRWEHDKNPEFFAASLLELVRRNIDFRVIFAGQSYVGSPLRFNELHKALGSRIIHSGYVESYQEYVSMLCRGHLVVSTSLHEFYGIAVIEAVRAGCIPLLPNRLAYPELFPAEYLYNDCEFTDKLEKALRASIRLEAHTSKGLTDRFSWHVLASHYRNWLFDEKELHNRDVSRCFVEDAGVI